MKLYPKDLRVIIKNNPLDNHPQAFPAAQASLAAHLQGKYWQYHDLLYQKSRNLDDQLFVELAKDLDLDLDKFNADRKSDKITQWINTDQAQAEKLRLRSVPAFVVNGVVVRGAKSITYFKQVIDRLLKEAKSVSASQPGKDNG